MDGDADDSNVGNQDGQVKDLGSDGEVKEKKDGDRSNARIVYFLFLNRIALLENVK